MFVRRRRRVTGRRTGRRRVVDVGSGRVATRRRGPDTACGQKHGLGGCGGGGGGSSRRAAVNNLAGVTERSDARTHGGVDRYPPSDFRVVVGERTVHAAVGYCHRYLLSVNAVHQFDVGVAVAGYRTHFTCISNKWSR